MNVKNQMISSFTLFFIAIIISTGQLFSQLVEIVNENVYSEGRFYFNTQDSILYSDAIVVKFNNDVIDVDTDTRYADISNVRSSFNSVISLIEELEQQYGTIEIIKQVLNAQWGETIRINKRTGEEVGIYDLSQLFTIKFSTPVPLKPTIDQFRLLPDVDFVHEPITYIGNVEPNDDFFNEQWNLEVIQSTKAWDITLGNSDVKIGIVDFGTDQDHEDLQNKIDGGDEVEAYHGTYVAGVAGSATNNATGIASLGWDVHLYTYGFPVEWGYTSYKVEDIDSAAQNCDIINMSWATVRRAEIEDINGIDCPFPDQWIGAAIPQSFQEIQMAVSNAISQGVVCIAGAGNRSLNAYSGRPDPEECDPMWIPFHSYPAEYVGVIAVSGTKLVDENEQFNDDWNYGDFIDLSAPGKNIKTTDLGGGYTTQSGTSFSSPLVSALASLIISLNSNLSINQVANILINTADKIDSDRYPYDGNGWNDHLGYGRINAYEALKYTLENYGGTLTGEVTISENITIAAGATLTIEPGATVKFNPGTRLTINGTLISEGTSTSRITYTSSSSNPSPDDWYGIVLNNSSGNVFRYSDVQYSSIGIWADNSTFSNNTIEHSKFNQNGTGFGLINTTTIQTLKDCQFNNNSWYGIIIWSSGASLENSQFNGNGYYGIHLYNALSTTIKQSYIQGNEPDGIACYANSDPWIRKPYGGYNTIKYNSRYGVYTDATSLPELGRIIRKFEYLNYGGYNEIYNNGSYEVQNDNTRYLYAQYNIWHGSYGDVSPRVVYIPALEYPLISSSEDPQEPLETLYVDGLIAMESENYQEARDIFTALIANYPNSDYAKKTVSRFVESYLFEGKPDSVLLGLQRLPVPQGNRELKNLIQSKLIPFYVRKGKFGKAKNIAVNLAVDSIRSSLIKQNSLFHAGLLSLHEHRGVQKAAQYFDQLLDENPQSSLEPIIALLLNRPPRLAKRIVSDDSKESEVQIPTEFTLNQNYPNPFNPITTIEYHLPIESIVKVTVYNLAGQAVRELVNDVRPVGIHKLNFDATTMASGMYFYRIEVHNPDAIGAAGFIQTRKMVVLK